MRTKNKKMKSVKVELTGYYLGEIAKDCRFAQMIML